MAQIVDILKLGAARDSPFDIVLTTLTKIPTLDQVILFWRNSELLHIELTVSEFLQNHSCDAATHEVLLTAPEITCEQISCCDDADPERMSCR